MSSFATNLLSLLSLQKQASTTSPTLTNNQLNNSISTLNTSIQNMSALLNESPFIALNQQDGSVNAAANTLIFAGIPVPVGYKLIVKDFNIYFTTSGGSVNIVIMDYNAKNVINTITPNISASSSGFGGTVIDETQCIAITINTQNASGVIAAYMSGTLKKKVKTF